MNEFWLFVVEVLAILGVLVGAHCWEKKDSFSILRWTWRTWLFCNACWMIALCISIGFCRAASDSSKEEACKAIMAAVQLEPGSPALAEVASDIYFRLPKYASGKHQQELGQYVRGVAKSWDDSKEVQ